jgi:hypothetical protein
MNDIWFGVVLMLLLSCAAFLLAARVARRVSMPVVLLLALLALTAVFVQALVLQENVLVARVLPLSNLIILGNWLPVAAGWLAGLAWVRTRGAVLRKCMIVLPLVGAGLYSMARPLLGHPPECADKWEDNVCIQTSDASCSPAGAATLLRYCGIEATEQEMARLCFTRRRGTPKYGLYRGLKKKTEGTPWKVAVFSDGIDGLRPGKTGPVLISVKLKRGAKVDPRYESEWGWEHGIAHAVVIFRLLDGGKVEVDDPSTGREQWTTDDLEILWNGQGYYLMKR